VVDQDDAVVAQARGVQVMYDYASGKPVPLSDAMKAKLRG
jgi:acyl-CoA thioesterase FadM